MTDPTYRVGYRRPPTHTQFKKGQSGNPRGKTKGRKSFKIELAEELGERVIVTEKGRRRLLSKQTLILKRMVADAVNGNDKARDQLIKLIDQVEIANRSSATAASTAPEDAEILARFKRRLIEEIKESESKFE